MGNSAQTRKNVLEQWFLTWVRLNPRGSLSHSQGFGRGRETHSIARFTLAMSGRFYTYLCFEEIIFYFSKITKGSVNALVKRAGFSTSNKVKNHCSNSCFHWLC